MLPSSLAPFVVLKLEVIPIEQAAWDWAFKKLHGNHPSWMNDQLWTKGIFSSYPSPWIRKARAVASGPSQGAHLSGSWNHETLNSQCWWSCQVMIIQNIKKNSSPSRIPDPWPYRTSPVLNHPQPPIKFLNSSSSRTSRSGLVSSPPAGPSS